MPPKTKKRRTRATVPEDTTSRQEETTALESTITAAVRRVLEEHRTERTTVQSVVRDAVDEIMASGGTSSGEPASPVFQSIAVPLGSRIVSKTKTKIWADEFIDFGALLDPSPNPEKFAISVASSSGTAKQPQLTLEPVQTPKKVTSIGQWVTAFHTFVAIYAVKFPGETPKLMKFWEIVRDIAIRGGDWNYYDEQFRFIRQSNPQQYPWDIVHWELWHRAVTFRAKPAPFQPDKSSSKPKGKQNLPKGFCWAFNSGRYCAGCRFEHKCYKCNGKHAASHCSSGGQPSTDRETVLTPGTKQPASNPRKGTNT